MRYFAAAGHQHSPQVPQQCAFSRWAGQMIEPGSRSAAPHTVVACIGAGSSPAFTEKRTAHWFGLRRLSASIIWPIFDERGCAV